MMNFTDISDHMKLNREARRAHLDLDTECILIGGKDSREYRGLLAYHLGTTIPTGKFKIVLCHACNTTGCSNPKHLYWGTRQDNHQDAVESGAWQSIRERTKRKYGNEKFQEMQIAAARRGGAAKRNSPIAQLVERRLVRAQVGEPFATVAQRIEQRSSKPLVGGPNPSSRATHIS